MVINRAVLILFWCLVAISVTEIYNLLPDSDHLYRMFPRSTQLISLQSWVDYGTTRIAYSVFFYILFRFIPRYSGQLFIFWVLSMIYFVDYIVFYNEPFMHVYVFHKNVPISFTLIRMGITISVIIKTIYDERWT